jgi:hypothetical protein
MSFYDAGVMEDLAKERINDLIRDADRERLASKVVSNGQPLRGRIADVLHALAERIDNRPRRVFRADELPAAA